MRNKLIYLSIAMVFWVFLLAGCTTTMRYSSYGKSTAVTAPFDVRITQANDKQMQDYHRSKRVGFTSTMDMGNIGVPMRFVDLSADQKTIVQLIGIPEYYCSFPSPSGKRVEEWIYLEQDYLVQFIYRKLVYLGSVDDKEKTIIELGPPTDIYTVDFAELRKDILIYKPRFEIYTFHNDKKVVGQ